MLLHTSKNPHNHDTDYAPAARGVTNGDNHDHTGGDGAQIDHDGLANNGANTHAQIDNHLAAANIVPRFAGQHTDITVTGTTSETTLATIPIPGNTMGPNGILRITILAATSSSTNNKYIRLKMGGGQVWQYNMNTSGYQTLGSITLVFNRNAANSQIWYPAYTFGGVSASAPATGSLDTTQNQNLTVTGQLANTGDNITLKAIAVEVLK